MSKLSNWMTREGKGKHLRVDPPIGGNVEPRLHGEAAPVASGQKITDTAGQTILTAPGRTSSTPETNKNPLKLTVGIINRSYLGTITRRFRMRLNAKKRQILAYLQAIRDIRVPISNKSIRRHLVKFENLTGEEQAAIIEEKKRKQLENTLRRECKEYVYRMQNALHRLGLSHESKKQRAFFLGPAISYVKFDYRRMSPDALYFHVDANRLPYGVDMKRLVDEDVLFNVAHSIGREVQADFEIERGMWYIVSRATGVMGIPVHVKIADMLQAMPASADGLTVPLGITANGKAVYRSLSRMYSILVGGTIGSGKSNILNVILCSLIRRNTPDLLKLILVDLKGGMEMSFYEGVPHLMPMEIQDPDHHGQKITIKGIIEDRKYVPELFSQIIQEGENRMKKIKAAGHKNIARYNQLGKSRGRLARIVLVIDEWADIKLEQGLGKRAEDMLTNIASRFRAVGIHVILCTQVPKANVISERVKGVMPAKLAFSCPTLQSSMTIIGNGMARELQPAGRFVFQHHGTQLIQAPYIPDSFVKETVHGAITGEYQKLDQGHDVTPLEVMEWSLEYDDGWLSERNVYDQFRDRGLSRTELREWLAAWEGQEFVIGSSLYTVDPPSGPKARRLIPVELEEYCDQNSG